MDNNVTYHSASYLEILGNGKSVAYGQFKQTCFLLHDQTQVWIPEFQMRIDEFSQVVSHPLLDSFYRDAKQKLTVVRDDEFTFEFSKIISQKPDKVCFEIDGNKIWLPLNGLNIDFDRNRADHYLLEKKMREIEEIKNRPAVTLVF